MKAKNFTKVILLFTFLGLSFNKANAQYVTIPDANFVAWLTNHYPGCMTGNQMDTTCAGIVNEDSIYVIDVEYLDGIRYFDNLKYLKAASGALYLNDVPDLPPLLEILDVSINPALSSLPSLPPSLKVLNCNNYGDGAISSLPVLPDSLEKLICDGNLITVLPNLPNTLKMLSCNSESNGLLPALPPGLEELYCYTGQGPVLISLPALPNSLKILWCGDNQLTSLPTLPNFLEVLVCANCQLTGLPLLPNTLITLDCSNNNISCLPVLPTSLANIFPWGFSILPNPISCLPNYLPVMNAATLAIPLCQSNDTVNNPNGCIEGEGIIGSIYRDNNGNCILDATDQAVQNIQVKFFNIVTNQFGSVFSSAYNVYSYQCIPGTYLVTLDTLNKPYSISCAYPGNDTIVVTSVPDPLISDINFSIACNPLGVNLGIQSIMHINGNVRPGKQHTLQVVAGDATQWYGLGCVNGLSGQVKITVTGPVTYNGPVAGAQTPSVNGNVYTYNIADFGTINNANNFELVFTTDTTAQSGDQICVNVIVTPITGDIDIANNEMNYCYTVINSFDPNYKEVYPTDVLPGYEDWLTYTIHFQNTGTAPAINIRLLDTLDTNLDEQTFEVINYSHYNTVTLIDSIIDFRFPNILLPDSTSDLAGSQGFVQYRIKPKANLPAGTQILNRANIYFDFNAPIVTNTTVNNFTTAVGTSASSPLGRKEVGLYPNPSTGIFTISSTVNIEVYNVVGELILSQNNTTTIDLSDEPKGIYFVKINGSNIKKLIKN